MYVQPMSEHCGIYQGQGNLSNGLRLMSLVLRTGVLGSINTSTAF